MEIQISNIEKAFLSLPSVANALGTAEIKKLVKVEANADAKRWEASKSIAKLVATAHAWYKSAEGKELMETEGIDWKVDDLYRCIGGWGKSYGNRLKSVGNLTEEQLTAYESLCEAEPHKWERSVNACNSWSRGGQGNAEGGAEGDGVEGEASENAKGTWVSIAVKGRNGESGFAIRINMDGTIKGESQRLPELIALLTEASGGGCIEPTIMVDADDYDDEEF
jgi:hypothetical protein